MAAMNEGSSEKTQSLENPETVKESQQTEVTPNASNMPQEGKNSPPKPKPGMPLGGMEKGFYRHFMNPLMSRMEEQVNKNNQLLDEISLKLEKEREESRKKKLSDHIPETIKGTGQELKEIIKHIEDLIVYENYDHNEKDDTKFIKARLKQLDENSEVAILSHSIGAFVSTLEPQHLRHFTNKIVSDVTNWVARLFRFKDGSVYFHEEEREGLIKICRLALHHKFPKYTADGYEALYARPPVFYVSAAAKPLLGQYMCAQLGLPMSCLHTVPCSKQLGSVQKMDMAALEAMIEDDTTSGKTPVLIVAYAGTPVVGSTDNISKLQEICKKEHMWLHLEGNNLATLTMYSVPTNILPARSGDSMTLNLSGWLGLPAVPQVTLFRCPDVNLSRAVGLAPANTKFRLNSVPLWTCLQNLGHEGVVTRIKYSLDLSNMVHGQIDKMGSLRNVVLFEIENPTVVFKYQPSEEVLGGAGPTETGAAENGESAADKVETCSRDPYYDALNIWLYETLRRDSPKVHITAVELDNVGVGLRFAPMESGQLFDTEKEDISHFLACMERQVGILDATVRQRMDFQDIVVAQDNLRLVNLPNWAGLGAIQYVPESWEDNAGELSESALNEVNNLNINLVHQLKSADTAFSLGQTDDGMNCARFGLITEETDLEELIALVFTTGKEVEESSKFLETMAEVVRQGIEKASGDLKMESQQKIAQEGVLRQVPMVGSLLNWWSPTPKEMAVKGRSFNLASGHIESTETTYKYRMQVQDSGSEVSPQTFKEGPLKEKLKPAKRRSHSRSHSDTSSTQDAVPATPRSTTATTAAPLSDTSVFAEAEEEEVVAPPAAKANGRVGSAEPGVEAENAAIQQEA